jgi:hypothetical protein
MSLKRLVALLLVPRSSPSEGCTPSNTWPLDLQVSHRKGEDTVVTLEKSGDAVLLTKLE